MKNKCENCAHLDVLASTCKKKKGYDKIVKMDDSCSYFEKLKEKCADCENCTCGITDTIVIGEGINSVKVKNISIDASECAETTPYYVIEDGWLKPSAECIKIYHTDGTVSFLKYVNGAWNRITVRWEV